MEYYAAKINENGTTAVDDSILVKGAESTYGSKILMGFKPLFSAEAVERLEKNGYLVSGKCHVGEFGLDLVGEFSPPPHAAGSNGRCSYWPCSPVSPITYSRLSSTVAYS